MSGRVLKKQSPPRGRYLEGCVFQSIAVQTARDNRFRVSHLGVTAKATKGGSRKDNRSLPLLGLTCEVSIHLHGVISRGICILNRLFGARFSQLTPGTRHGGGMRVDSSTLVVFM
ncbi:hypothetical protein AVEN_50967-1 [Araneus ventricosus]|uniref:Uncharacterized protein n=1 Tax=Araneus ventricosus TaxID=182803 RepID=A0A4Y2CAF8_ARAVE|nr:hypothetical protein AVEN_50967-1 [Araneus ventricosus]